MKLFSRSRVFQASMAASATGVLLFACKSAGSVKGGIDTGPVHVSFDLSGSSAGQADGVNDSNQCFEVKWYDAHGNEVGSATLTPGPNHGPVPAGATNYTAVSKDCPHGGVGGMAEPDGDDPWPTLFDAATPAVEPLAATAASGGEYQVFGGPLGFADDSPTSNAIYEFRVRATSSDEACALARQALTAPLDGPPDGRITILSWLRATQNGSSGRLVGLAPRPFTSFHVALNDDADFADLATAHNAVQSALPSGLYMVEAGVAASDVNGWGRANHVRVEHRHGGLTSGQVETAEVTMTLFEN